MKHTIFEKCEVRSITKIQWLTLIAIIAYAAWEWVILADWKAQTAGPLIRVDLVIMYPILIVLVGISVWQQMSKQQ